MIDEEKGLKPFNAILYSLTTIKATQFIIQPFFITGAYHHEFYG
jgi:hypothetical protein